MATVADALEGMAEQARLGFGAVAGPGSTSAVLESERFLELEGDQFSYDEEWVLFVTPRLFAVTDTGLYLVDPASGAASMVGELGPRAAAIASLTEHDGVLVAADTESDLLLAVDPESGAADPYAPAGEAFSSGGAGVFDVDGTLYGAAALRGADVVGAAVLDGAAFVATAAELRTLDVASATSSAVGPFGTPMTALAAWRGGLFASSGAALYSVNPKTGAATEVGAHGVAGVTGLASYSGLPLMRRVQSGSYDAEAGQVTFRRPLPQAPRAGDPVRFYSLLAPYGLGFTWWRALMDGLSYCYLERDADVAPLGGDVRNRWPLPGEAFGNAPRERWPLLLQRVWIEAEDGGRRDLAASGWYADGADLVLDRWPGPMARSTLRARVRAPHRSDYLWHERDEALEVPLDWAVAAGLWRFWHRLNSTRQAGKFSNEEAAALMRWRQLAGRYGPLATIAV